MMKNTLYLHVGWSKTGTSAIQSKIQQQVSDFENKGILYPQNIQWPDHSHHPFALSFKGSGAYQGNMTPPEAIEKLRLEMESSRLDSVLLSSELSPFYFNNPRFKVFVEKNFKQVKVLFTIRNQSELLLSLFNQLVKDPNVRYDGSLFALAMRNINWIDFNKNINKWRKVVGSENLAVIPYSKSVVQDFFSVFDIPVSLNEGVNDPIVNPSLPTRCLSILQAKGRDATDNASFTRIKNDVIKSASTLSKENDKYLLFSVPEQQSFDDLFKPGNIRISEEFGFNIDKILKTKYEPVKVIPPGLKM